MVAHLRYVDINNRTWQLVLSPPFYVSITLVMLMSDNFIVHQVVVQVYGIVDLVGWNSVGRLIIVDIGLG